MSMYDDSISENISLSRILDAMILSEEKSDVIVKFLKMYDKDFKHIAERSLYISRLFCSEYLRKCSFLDAQYILSHLDDINDCYAAYCAWQCLMLANRTKDSSNASKYDYLEGYSAKFIEKLNTKNQKNKFKIAHPHSRFSSNFIKNIDAKFIVDGFCPEDVLSSLSCDVIKEIIVNSHHSLLATRLFQADCFSACSNLRKFVIVKNLSYVPSFMLVDFIKQLLVSDEEPEIKYEVLENYDINLGIYSYVISSNNNELFKLVQKAKDYASIAVPLALNGEDAIADAVLWMLCFKKYNVLAEMAELDEDAMQRNFPVKDLVEYIIASKKRIKKACKQKNQ